MWMSHKAVNLTNPPIHVLKTIDLAQHQIPCINLEYDLPLSSPDWLWVFFFSISFLISVIVVTFPQLSCWLYLSGGQLIQEGIVCHKLSKWLLCVCVWNTFVRLWLCVFVCVCVIKEGVWNLKLLQDVQINDSQPELLSLTEMNHPVKLWCYIANNNTWLWVVRGFTHLRHEKGRKKNAGYKLIRQ